MSDYLLKGIDLSLQWPTNSAKGYGKVFIAVANEIQQITLSERKSCWLPLKQHSQQKIVACLHTSVVKRVSNTLNINEN